MAEIYPSDSELNALLSDAETGVEYIPTGTAPYYTHFRRLLYRLLLATKRANDFRLYPEGGLTYGIKPGQFFNGQNLVEYPGSSGNVLADNQLFYVYLDATGTIQFKEQDYWHEPFGPEVWLAEVTTLNGEITSIVDKRAVHSMAMPQYDRPVIIEKSVSGDQLNHAESGCIVTNAGATGDIVVYLPTFDLAGTRYTFCVQEDFNLIIDPLSKNIRCWSGGGTPGYTLYSSTIGDCVTLVSDGNGNWMSTAKYGSWATGIS